MTRYLLLFVLYLIAQSGLAQSDPPQVTKKYFIKNGNVITRPGTELVNTSILIEDGIITKVGSNLSAPYDAVVIPADSMYVYPAFIGGLSHIGLKKAEEDNKRPKVERPGYPPNDIAGITPEMSIASTYSASESSISGFREAGFAIAHVVPEGRMMPGKGSIISLNGAEYSDAVIKEDVSLYAQFRGANRIFPATTIGVMAKWRELYKNAELSKAHGKAFAMNPRNKKRPSPDAATEALYPVINKDIPVYFLTEEHLDIYRALQLQKDLGFNIVLSEMKMGTKALSKVKSTSAKVLLSLDLPKEEKKNDKAEDVSDEQTSLMEKKMESIMAYEKQSADFEAANTTFAYSLMDTKAKDVMPAIHRMMKQGLSYDGALAALTTNAAAQLNISNMTGTIETGKMGNILIATDSIFNADAKIKMVFVDGHQYEIEIKEKKKSGGNSDAVVEIAGTWNYEIEIPGMTPSGKMMITKDGDEIKMSITSDQEPGDDIDAENVEMDGSNMTYDFTVDTQGMSITINSDVTFDGDTFEGTVDVGDFGSFAITGQKINSPE